MPNDDDKVINIDLNIASDDDEPQEINIDLNSGNGIDGVWWRTIDLD